MKEKIYFLSLGCPRNLVDSEVMLGLLKKDGFKFVDEPSKSTVAIINTCSFIDEAMEETTEAILSICRLKQTSGLKKVIVCGCFVQRFGKDLLKELPEVDGFVGTNEILSIKEVVEQVLDGERIFCCFENKNFIYNKKFQRYLLTPKHTSYLKISEGCRHRCSFCIIPKLKGRYRSRAIEDIVGEAKALAKNGCREFNIIGQDTTYYGFDLYRREALPDLLKELAKIEDIEWIRLLYAYPDSFTDDLIKTIAGSPKICKYIDIPIQHINDKILKAMNRGTTKEDIINLIETLRATIKDVCLRTSLLVGFPGEEDDDFEELLEFMKWVKFERLGIFKYSKQKGTPSAAFEGQISESVKEKRFNRAFKFQRSIAEEVNRNFLGKTLKVIIDETREDFSLGRTEFDAPEVDGLVYVYPAPQEAQPRKPRMNPASFHRCGMNGILKHEGKHPKSTCQDEWCGVYADKKLKPGSFVNVEITDTLEYDLVGKAKK